MAALNQKERNRFILNCVASYLMAVLLVGVIFYFQFVVTPRVYSRETALTNDKIEEFVKYTNDADSLVVQIQRAGNLEAKSLVPFYDWTNNLKAVYKQPFYNAVIVSYTDLVNDIAQAHETDTTLSSLKNSLVSLQKKNLELMQQGETLKEDLNKIKQSK